MDLIKAKEALKQYFGYDQFRPMQGEIIQSIYDGKDSLVLMPTGGGKSICYQIPAVTLDGMTLVISPLIALMKDQVENLRANGVAAAFINSSMSSKEQQAVEHAVLEDQLKLLYVSPEKLVSQQFFPLLSQANINLFAIDEAHCISAWGHDFRPEYTQLQFLKKQFKHIPIIALTATADKITRRDILKQLQLGEAAHVFVSSFDRPNISLDIRPGQQKLQQIVAFLTQHPKQAGIIYCLSRKNTEDLAGKLQASGFNAKSYHAGMSPKNRSQVQEAFINDNIDIVCATIAFGMGIDKSNVRWIMHYNLPKNMEGYYQEIGRAGRDGTEATAILFYSFRDVMVLRDILSQNDSDHTEIKLAKLERMQQYADSFVCRRKILLSYFGENLEKDCGNCDVCKNPPQFFEGTVIAQKALSACIRLKEQVGINMLVDVLRGSQKREIFEKGYNKIKTYGLGGDISYGDWQRLLRQMLHIGLIEIAYDQHHRVKVTEAGKAVLFNNRKIQLIKIADIRERQKAQKEVVKQKTQRERVRDELFEVLRQLRKKLAQQKGIPPYIVFSDKTLEEMAAARPVTEAAMRNISGVGDVKMREYGELFITAILEHLGQKVLEGVKIPGASPLQTLQLHKKGLNISQISIERALSEQTIIGHLLELYRNGHPVRWNAILKQSELNRILDAVQGMEPPIRLRPIFESLNEELDYDKIRMGVAYYEREILGVE